MNQPTQLDSQQIKDKQLLFGDESREKLLTGIDLVADAVSATLGPRGRNVVIEQTRTAGIMQNTVGLMPRITKDGVSVAREINVSDKFENLGVQIIKEVASRQNDRAGDGTTTATVLAQSIAHQSIDAISKGTNPVILKRELDEATTEALKFLDFRAKDVSDIESLRSIATISANGDEEVGNIVSSAVEAVGLDGIISVEQAPTTEMTLDVVEGMEFPAGFASPHFITDTERGIADLRDCWVLFYDSKINDIKEVLGVITHAHESEKSLVIVCNDIADDVLATLVLNKMRNGLRIAVLKLPEFLPHRTEFMDDLAIVTGGTVIGTDSGISLGSVTDEHFGKCRRVRVNSELSEFIEGEVDKEALDAQVVNLKAKLDGIEKSDHAYPVLSGRLAKLSGGIAVIRVGGSSEIDIGERKDRIEDAINATRAAVEEGIVAGGGTSLLFAAENLSRNFSASEGSDIIIHALKAPFATIMHNAGLDDGTVNSSIITVTNSEYGHGYNADTDEFMDLIAAGVIDPAKVVKNALKDAVGVVGLLITTEVSIVNEDEE